MRSRKTLLISTRTILEKHSSPTTTYFPSCSSLLCILFYWYQEWALHVPHRHRRSHLATDMFSQYVPRRFSPHHRLNFEKLRRVPRHSLVIMKPFRKRVVQRRRKKKNTEQVSRWFELSHLWVEILPLLPPAVSVLGNFLQALGKARVLRVPRYLVFWTLSKKKGINKYINKKTS